MSQDVLELADQQDRTLIEEKLDANVFVEAGAGSGKTHELVERICAIVAAGVELKSIAAITFTEKAAGELRERVRRRLEDDASSPARNTALEQLDTAPIGTIHSFAARLISEHPIETGVPPLITVVDELRSQVAFPCWSGRTSTRFMPRLGSPASPIQFQSATPSSRERSVATPGPPSSST